MSVDMFLNLNKGKIKGESVDETHKDELDILSWSWGASQSGSVHAGSGAGAGKVSVQDLSLTKWVDKSTPVLLAHCCSGKHIDEATLTVRKAGGKKPLEYLKITMFDILVSSISTGGSGGEDRLTENISLNFARFKLEYIPQKADGTGEASIPAAWNIAKNTEKLS
jgi:type VI secretion system secreted protein Hcp